MKKINQKLTIIKYGSDTLVYKNINNKIAIDYNNIAQHGLIINKIKNPVMIVSSGAVAFGKIQKNNFNYIKDDVIKKRIFAAIGNPHLSVNWSKAITNKTLLQSLVTHRDLTTKDSKEKISKILFELYQKNNAIVQVNDNDFVTDEELTKIRGGDFGDNDKITSLLAELCSNIFEKVEVVINTSADGVLENDNILPTIKTKNLSGAYIKKICNIGKSDFGTGGMANKLKILKDMIQKNKNITAYIVNGKKPEDLKQILKGKQIGTKIIN